MGTEDVVMEECWDNVEETDDAGKVAEEEEELSVGIGRMNVSLQKEGDVGDDVWWSVDEDEDVKVWAQGWNLKFDGIVRWYRGLSQMCF